jgi:hypothetical protein
MSIQPYGAVPERQIVQNPVSLIGSAKRIWPAGYGSEGWRAVLRWTGVVLLVTLAWVGVLAVYLGLCFLPVLWIVWGIWTMRRRHFIYDRRRYGQRIGD